METEELRDPLLTRVSFCSLSESSCTNAAIANSVLN